MNRTQVLHYRFLCLQACNDALRMAAFIEDALDVIVESWGAK